MSRHILATAFVITAVVCLQARVFADVVIIDEDFADFGTSQTYSGGVTVTWSDNDGSPAAFERYDTPSDPRNVDDDYDHDDNAGTPQVDLAGGLEVNDDGGNMTLVGSFTLPGSVDENYTLDLDFGADPRAGFKSATVQIYNV